MRFEVGDRVRALHEGEGHTFDRKFHDAKGTVMSIEDENYSRVHFDTVDDPGIGRYWYCRNDGMVKIAMRRFEIGDRVMVPLDDPGHAHGEPDSSSRTYLGKHGTITGMDDDKNSHIRVKYDFQNGREVTTPKTSLVHVPPELCEQEMMQALEKSLRRLFTEAA